MIRKFFTPPIYAGDEEKTRAARLLNTILLAQLLLAAVPVLHLIVAPSSRTVIIPVLMALLLPVAGMLYFMRRGFVRATGIALVVFLLAATGLLDFFSGGNSWLPTIYYPLAIVVAGLLLGGKSAMITAIASSISLGVITYTGVFGTLPKLLPTAPASIAIFAYIIGFVVIGIVLQVASGSLETVRARAQEGEKQLLESNRQLRELSASLEQKINARTAELARRTHDLESANRHNQRRAEKLEAIAQVTQAIISIRDLGELLPRIATVISARFGFYHVGVFLLDEINEFAVLSATNSDGGRQMLERKHRLRVGEQGIVGNVTYTGIPRIAMDVGSDPVYFNNAELPDTHSEMALPLKSGDQIIGALDVQSTERGAFTDEDIQMLSLLANQVSLAIENARLFEETRRALSESEAISRQITREAWRSLPAEHNLLGYRYTVTGTTPLQEPVDLTESANDKTASKPAETNRIVVPIELRGEMIGTLVVQSPAASQINSDQIDLIKAVAERVAISAENARLFDETTRRAERERKVSDITSKIRSVNDPQAMIQTAIEELRNALGASRVEVVPQTIKGAE